MATGMTDAFWKIAASTAAIVVQLLCVCAVVDDESRLMIASLGEFSSDSQSERTSKVVESAT